MKILSQLQLCNWQKPSRSDNNIKHKWTRNPGKKKIDGGFSNERIRFKRLQEDRDNYRRHDTQGQVVGKINFSLRNKIQLFNKYIFTKNILNIKRIVFIQLLKWFKFKIFF